MKEELRAIGRIAQILDKFDVDGRDRILNYLFDRYQKNDHVEETKTNGAAVAL